MGQQRLLVDASSEGIPVLQGLKDAPVGGRIFSGPSLFHPLKKIFVQAHFSGEETGLGQDGIQCVTVGSQRGADAATVVSSLQGDSLGRGISLYFLHC